MDVTLTVYDAAGSTYSLVNASSPWKLVTWDWGNAVWDQQFSGPRGTLGARPTFSQVGNRQVAVGLRLVPASKSAAPGHLSDLAEVIEGLRRYGGRVTVTTASVTYRQHLEVLAGSAMLQNWTTRSEVYGRVDYALGFVCEPYVRGDSMAVTDTLGNGTADYTFDSGAASNISVSNGEWAPASAGVTPVAIHTAYGYSYGDVRALVTAVPSSTIANSKAGVVIKRTSGASGGTRLECYVDDDGVNSRLRIDTVIAGVRANLATTNLGTRISAGTPFRVAGSIAGNVVTAKVFQTFIANADFDRSADATVSATLAGANVTTFGHNVTGQCGIVWTPANTGAALDDFAVQPFWYDVSAPAGHIVMRGSIPGDAPALGQVEVVATAGGVSTPKAAVIGFAKQPANRNFISDGSFDIGLTGTVARPWVVTAVAGVTGAATSISYLAPGRFGNACAQVVTPATAGTGASSAIYGPFYAGVTYRATCWVKSASNTTTTRLIFGVSGDQQATAGVALSTTWTQKTIDWTPATTTYVAYVAVEVTAATLTTFQLDSVDVHEVGKQPTSVTQTRGRGGRPPHALLVADEAHSLTTFAMTAIGGGWPVITGTGLQVTGSTSAAVAKWRLDPTLLDPAHHTSSAEMEVWCWVTAPATTWTSPKLIASLAGGDGGQSTYTREFGSTGYTPSGTGLHRLGTLSIPLNENGQVDLVLRETCSAMTGNLQIPWVILVPPHRRILAPATPGLMPTPSSGSATAAEIREDGLVRVRTFQEPGWSASPGIGQTVTLEPGAAEIIYAFQGTTAATAAALNCLRVTPTPRWHHLRDA